MRFIENAIGKKIVMAITGLLMLAFIIIHLAGNSTIYFGWLNVYAEYLHSLPPLTWMCRIVMLIVFSIHLFFGVQLTMENRAAKPKAYAVKKSLRAAFSGKNMIWTGIIIAAFLIYHLLHFTIQTINPEISASMNADIMGRPDVFKMVTFSFQKFFVALIYIVAMTALFLHLKHGAQSFLQTFGANNERTLPVIIKAGTTAAVILFLGYISIPIIIFIGILRD
ncbi:MAG: succinate dehydrogenase cytochrome b subunit [Nitrospirae bacterium]|nr:succinate dehydrogenase cytochrome b subunit [Nitrospirota bacterium]